MNVKAVRLGTAEPPRNPDIRRCISKANPVILLGAGPAALGVALNLGEDALLVESANELGGLCRIIEFNCENGKGVRNRLAACKEMQRIFATN